MKGHDYVEPQAVLWDRREKLMSSHPSGNTAQKNLQKTPTEGHMGGTFRNALLQGYLRAASTRPMLCGECEELVFCFMPLCFNLLNQRPQLLLQERLEINPIKT